MPKKIAPAFYFIGNHPVLDFINTKIVVDGKPVDLLENFSDVLAWLPKADLLSKEETEEYEQRWGSGGQGEPVVTAARALRSSLLAMIQKRKEEDKASEEDMEHINSLLTDQVITTRLVRRDNRFASERHVKIHKPIDLLIPIAEAAIVFFSHYDLHLVKKCENPDCVLHFYDNSKNNTRRWCSQKTCGNRMKVAAFLERRRNQ
ncbi:MULTISPECIES: ABATE domain-containing protein [unclassified Paenibacillus]|uniref:CGNR zinc finger domain-containing protein n=1 Tax=unclassified Paenibacillus TaxID=185978 RepID=UPI00278741E0|nr:MULTISPECIES: ABATE domain-containing protein [unclassified Paenibacillus]MDQ0899143.1 putative RNA-binding Zn ribbon-like protein [Paenibacillus sp. V4I7]MDQ0914872.1 putative RNA-binding Zn ribbon-like protein [Paenibacillus sp. V4I5]